MPTTKRIFVCSDLDRTILPNGKQPESENARPLLRRLAARPEVVLAYVTGRHKELLQQGMKEYGLPEPDWAVGDVGTTIHEVARNWTVDTGWRDEIAPDFAGKTRQDLENILGHMDGVRLQEDEKQNEFKLSYYARPDMDGEALANRVEQRLRDHGVKPSVIWSVNEASGTGLLDVIPERATKLHAVRFLIKKLGIPLARTAYSGDSGNDMAPLTSEIPATLVANATDEVRSRAVELAGKNGNRDTLYLARGGFLGMNGNYAAGVLEGLVHYLPETRGWLE